MASFVIEGGHKLHGEIHPQGAKNRSVTDSFVATLLTSEEVTVTNIPDHSGCEQPDSVVT